MTKLCLECTKRYYFNIYIQKFPGGACPRTPPTWPCWKPPMINLWTGPWLTGGSVLVEIHETGFLKFEIRQSSLTKDTLGSSQASSFFGSTIMIMHVSTNMAIITTHTLSVWCHLHCVVPSKNQSIHLQGTLIAIIFQHCLL